MAAFREWVRSEGLERTGALDELAGNTIGFDAEEYLDSLLTTTRTREPLLPALGGQPFALKRHVDDDLQTLRDAGVKARFVFNGLEPATKDQAMVGREARKAAKKLDEAWSIYDQGRGDDAVVAFGKACTYRTYYIVRWLQSHLHRSGVFVETAPYTAAPQLMYLSEREEAPISAIYGSANCVAFGAKKVITNISTDGRTFSWIESHKLMPNKPHLVTDWLLLSGCTSLLPALPEVDNEPTLQKIERTRQLITQSNDGSALCLAQKNDGYTAAFQKAKAVVMHPVVCKMGGKVEIKDPQTAPNDVFVFLGSHLPDQLLFYLARGVAGPRVLRWHVTNQIVETPPLDGGSSQPYRDLVTNKLVPLHEQALNVAAAKLARYFKNKAPVDLYTWFDDSKRPISFKEAPDAMDTAGTWHVQDELLRGVDKGTPPLTAAIKLLSNADTAKATVSKYENYLPSGPLSTPTEMLANTVFRFLQTRGYVNRDHTLSAWGVALKAALDQAERNGYIAAASAGGEAEEAIMMAFELLRLKILNNENMFPTPPFSGQPLRGDAADKANILLISRVACLGLFGHQAIGYTGPLSRHLLAYHQMAAAVRLSLRDLLEMHACTLLISGAVDWNVSPHELTELGTNLPLGREPDLGLALVVKSYLDELSNESSKRADITKWFNYVLDIDSDLEKAWKMWDAINAGVQAAEISSLANEKKLFKTADEWLHKKLARTSHTNGATNGIA